MRPGITQEQVSAAADSIVLAGDKPTVEKIRAHLGTGSPNTITRMIAVWRHELASRLQEKLALPELPAPVSEAMATLWQAAIAHARELAQTDLQATRDQLAAQRAAVDAQAAEQIRAQQANQVALARLETERTHAQQRITELTVQRDAALQDAAAWRDAIQAAQREAESQRGELSDLRATLQQTRDGALAERARFDARLESVENRALRDIDQARQQTKSLRDELAAARRAHAGELVARNKEATELRRDLRTAEAGAARLAGRVAALEAALAKKAATVVATSKLNPAKRRRKLTVSAPRDRA